MAKLKGKAKAAFLAKMARGRRKHKKHTTTKKRKRKHKTGGHHVAKRRHHKSKSRKSTRRRHSGGGLSRWLPDQHKLVGIGTAFGYGKVEKAASGDAAHFLNKVPPIIGQIGRAGNLGAMLWLAGVVTRHPIVKSVASGVLHVAAYQNGRGGGFTKDAPDFKMSGPGRPGRGRDELLVEEYMRRKRNQQP